MATWLWLVSRDTAGNTTYHKRAPNLRMSATVLVPGSQVHANKMALERHEPVGVRVAV